MPISKELKETLQEGNIIKLSKGVIQKEEPNLTDDDIPELTTLLKKNPLEVLEIGLNISEKSWIDLLNLVNEIKTIDVIRLCGGGDQNAENLNSIAIRFFSQKILQKNRNFSQIIIAGNQASGKELLFFANCAAKYLAKTELQVIFKQVDSLEYVISANMILSQNKSITRPIGFNSSVMIFAENFKKKFQHAHEENLSPQIRNYAEIRRISRMLAQGYRDSNSLFKAIPENVLCKIAAAFGDSTIHDEEQSYDIAYVNFGRP